MTFDSSTGSISCEFLNQSQRESEKQCIANVTYGANCGQNVGIFRGSGMGNSVTVPPFMFADSVSELCIFVTAISGNATAIVEQKVNLLTNRGDEPTVQTFIIM